MQPRTRTGKIDSKSFGGHVVLGAMVADVGETVEDAGHVVNLELYRKERMTGCMELTPIRFLSQAVPSRARSMESDRRRSVTSDARRPHRARVHSKQDVQYAFGGSHARWKPVCMTIISISRERKCLYTGGSVES